MPLRVESGSFHQSCPGPDGIRSIENASRQVLFEQRIFPLIFISTIRQILCLNRFCYCVSDVKSFLCEYRLNTPTFFEITATYSHCIRDLQDLIFDYTI